MGQGVRDGTRGQELWPKSDRLGPGGQVPWAVFSSSKPHVGQGVRNLGPKMDVIGEKQQVVNDSGSSDYCKWILSTERQEFRN